MPNIRAMPSRSGAISALATAGWTGFVVTNLVAVTDAPVTWFFLMYPAMALAAVVKVKRG